MSDGTPHAIDVSEFDICCRGSIVQFDLPLSGGRRAQWQLHADNAVAFAEGLLGVVAAAKGKDGQ